MKKSKPLSGETKKGRPPRDEDRDDLTFVGFKADPETRLAIQYLAAVMKRQSGVIPSRSVVIRHYLIEAYKQAYAAETRETPSVLLPVDAGDELLAADFEPPAPEPKTGRKTAKSRKRASATPAEE